MLFEFLAAIVKLFAQFLLKSNLLLFNPPTIIVSVGRKFIFQFIRERLIFKSGRSQGDKRRPGTCTG